jgi:Fungal protein kinase
VSVGNILSCDGVAKLADLEYAKETGDVTSHEMRTASESFIDLSGKSLTESQQGTMHFMSIEVAAQTFLFRPPSPRDSASADEMIQRAETIQNVTASVPFSHNHLHDLESLWWVAVWMVFYNYFSEVLLSDDRPLKLTDVEKQLKLARTLFPLSLKSFDRLVGFQTSFRDTCVGLPSNKKTICYHLDSARAILIKHYKIVESTLPQSIEPNASKNEIYEDFTKFFSASRDASRDMLLDFIPKIYTKLKKGKRPRSESTSDTGVAQKTPRRK